MIWIFTTRIKNRDFRLQDLLRLMGFLGRRGNLLGLEDEEMSKIVSICLWVTRTNMGRGNLLELEHEELTKIVLWVTSKNNHRECRD